jgi:hypothetical protein
MNEPFTVLEEIRETIAFDKIGQIAFMDLNDLSDLTMSIQCTVDACLPPAFGNCKNIKSKISTIFKECSPVKSPQLAKEDTTRSTVLMALRTRPSDEEGPLRILSQRVQLQLQWNIHADKSWQTRMR